MSQQRREYSITSAGALGAQPRGGALRDPADVGPLRHATRHGDRLSRGPHQQRDVGVESVAGAVHVRRHCAQQLVRQLRQFDAQNDRHARVDGRVLWPGKVPAQSGRRHVHQCAAAARVYARARERHATYLRAAGEEVAADSEQKVQVLRVAGVVRAQELSGLCDGPIVFADHRHAARDVRGESDARVFEAGGRVHDGDRVGDGGREAETRERVLEPTHRFQSVCDKEGDQYPHGEGQGAV